MFLRHRLFLVLLLSLFLLGLQVTYQEEDSQKAQAQAEPKASIEPKALDGRAEILQAYLATKNSPLQYHAQDFVDAADHYQMDWKLVAAISGVESTFGKAIPGGHGPNSSYNGWGWGVYGNNSLGFKSWRDGIFTVSEGLKTKYINKGLKDPVAMNRIYAASPTWGIKVNYFLSDIQNYAQDYTAKKPAQLVTYTKIEAKTVGASAELK